eukprot:TRINITY_DN67784_c0_g1_i1.p1 TRINITY_DN67784_c0_g1~~TRINITY_DN67784_c0_g1_i1.p1  ORF type:complete len:141 (+),score=24.09 TRINITY_DN67784_c0_g1_i1:56-424(+)
MKSIIAVAALLFIAAFPLYGCDAGACTDDEKQTLAKCMRDQYTVLGNAQDNDQVCNASRAFFGCGKDDPCYEIATAKDTLVDGSNCGVGAMGDGLTCGSTLKQVCEAYNVKSESAGWCKVTC